MGVHPPPGLNSAFDSIAARLRVALERRGLRANGAAATDVQGHARLVTMPPLNRTPMAPRES